MKKFIALMLAFIMIFSFAACGSGDDDDGDEGEKVEKSEKKDNAEVSLELDFGSDGKDDKNDGTDAEETESVTERADEDDDEPKNTEKQTYLVCTDVYYEPFTFYYEDGEYTGFDIDLLNAIAAEEDFNIYYSGEDFETALDALANGDYDGMISAMTKTAEREMVYDFSEAYFTDGIAIVVLGDSGAHRIEDMSGCNIGCVSGSYGEYSLSYESDTYGYETVVFDDYESMYDALLNGKIDALAEEYSFAGWRIMNMGYDMVMLDELLYEESYYFIVPKGENPELIEMFNDGLEEIRDSGTYETLLAKYGFDLH